jgi:structural maintenance of chromosome 2
MTKFISLDHVNPRVIDNVKIDLAKKIAAQHGGRVWVPFKDKQVVECTTKGMDKVLQDLFGNFFICDNMKVAKMIAFDRNIKVNCVTLDGDKVMAQGMMSGGYNQKKNTPLRMWNKYQQIGEKIKQFKKLQQELKDLQETFERDDVKLESDVDELKNCQMLSRRLEMQLREFNGASRENKIKNCQAKITQFRGELKDLAEKITKLKND